MYLTQFLQYLIWPVFILISLYAVRYALSVYEKMFPGEDDGTISQE
jgi:hypothetical protein